MRAASSIDRADSRASGSHVRRARLEREPERCREVPAEPLVRISLGAAQLMIEMRHARERQFSSRLEVAQDVEQRDRIRSTRQRDEDTGAAGKHARASESCAERGDERHVRR